MKIRVKINGTWREDDVEPRLLLVHYLREVAGLTGTHIGCETSICGACTVLVGGNAVKSRTIFAVQADGAEVTARFTRCSRASGKSTGCSAGSALPA